MQTRFLGTTGLQVSAIAFGAMTFAGARSPFFREVGTTELDGARRQVDMCLNAGVNLFDTADVYSDGASEEMLGAALGARRADVLVATKVHGAMPGDANERGQSRHHIVRACEASLRRLGTDWIDLYQLHGVDLRTDPERVIRALDDLVTAGKVRYVGCSNFSAWQLMKYLAVADARGRERFACLQAYYSLVARELEHELVPACIDQGLGILVWSPLSGGFLTGKFRRGRDDAEGTRFAKWGGPGGIDRESGYDVVEELVAIASARGASPAQVALNWLLAKPGVTSLIVGARTEDQLADNLGAAAWSLSGEEVARLDRASERPLPYPLWHQLRYNAERSRPAWATPPP
jgi:aryl-alcohol dehydrogenase-like predicted oxidoreductase